ncbi:ATP-binding protein [uncultured Propionibacterium sp.]|uniref:ATP-binding protein n=1 Tax=uncultured Propionibacterium sp. TaxID=218066 RepID=UPI002930630F|nr:ATP-binding protein [uncultured Propionibacterium sp.]
MSISAVAPQPSDPFKFEFSLTVLNHLGRQLYRNFITVLGEAISNAWDADAENVWINIDHENRMMIIRDDGTGMTRDDIQNKFLKIGYSKRKDGSTKTPRGRPYIGAKGIGKLALLSCADSVTIVSRTGNGASFGCTIDNNVIDEAIDEDRSSQEVTLPDPTEQDLHRLDAQDHGTAILFKKVRMSNSTDEFLRKALALFYRFSLVDDSFSIFLNDAEITVSDAKELAESTQYLWRIGDSFKDPFLELVRPSREGTPLKISEARGFLATVAKPRDLIVFGAKEKVGVDLFVNGRLRERDILSHRPSARVPAQYIYGQIHMDVLDSGTNDPFTSNRESIKEDDPRFNELLNELSRVVNQIYAEWDDLRIEDRQDGDDDNPKRTKKKRAALRLTKEQTKELFPETGTAKSKKSRKAFDELLEKAEGDLIESLDDYSHIYILENLMRQIATQYSMKLSKTEEKEADKNKSRATENFSGSGLREKCRSSENRLWYLGLADLLKVVDRGTKPQGNNTPLKSQLESIRYLRNIVMHTAGLTTYGRRQLESRKEAIAANLKTIIIDRENLQRNSS